MIGIRRKKYSIDDSYFNTIDSEDKAYFLGLMMSDGCVYKNRLILGLINTDRAILESFKEALKYTGPLYTHRRQCVLSVRSPMLTNSLRAIGCVEKKSLVLNFPTLKWHLVPHFIRGCWDGDGSFTKHGSFRAAYCSASINFITSMLNELNNECSLGLRVEGKSNGSGTLYTIQTSKQSLVGDIMDYLYKDATIYLERKYNYYKLFKQKYYEGQFAHGEGS